MTLKLQEKNGAVTLECIVATRASKSTIKGIRNGMLAVSLRSPPIDGRANEELIKIISNTLSVPKSSITILRGQTNRQKVLRVEKVSKEYVNARLID